MPLNYSKWDNLELSDDSDIEGHPNVDKKSLIRWKQRDIHEKRDQRNVKIDQLKHDITVNEGIRARIQTISKEFAAADDGLVYFSSKVEQLKTRPAPDVPVLPAGAAPQPNAQKYDEMVLEVLISVFEAVKGSGLGKDDAKFLPALREALDKEIVRSSDFIAVREKEVEALVKEKAKKITTEDIHDGFESKYIPAKPEPPPVPGADVLKPKTTTKTTKSTTQIEVLNPKAVEEGPIPSAAVATSSTTTSTITEVTDPEEETSLPQMTPSLEQFSRLPYRAFEQSYRFIQAHRDVVVPGAADALLVAAFNAESNGDPKYSKQCIHQSLLLQYCEKLGGDGVRVFFQKMMSGNPQATAVFIQDVEQTYAHLVNRVAAAKEEEEAAGGEAQIQLVPENPDTQISFNVPDGPPPADLRLEGPGTEGMDVEEVRRVLQMRWDVFDAFAPNMKEALKSNELDKVNHELARMPVDDAEALVAKLDAAGILNFAEGGIRDETGGDAEGDDEGDE